MICLVSCVYATAKWNYLEEMRYTALEFREILEYSRKEIHSGLIDHEIIHQEVHLEGIKTLFGNRKINPDSGYQSIMYGKSYYRKHRGSFREVES